VLAAETLEVTVGGGAPQIITFGNGPGEVSTLAELSAALAALTGVNSSIDADGNISLVATSPTDEIAIGGTANAAEFGITTTTALPASETVIASDVPAFLDQTVGGGAVTAYDAAGAPVNIQIRWAKTDAAKYGGVDTWQMFYQSDTSATGIEPAWRNAGVAYTFGPNGQLNPAVTSVTLSNVQVDGLSLGDVRVDHGVGGITQFADPNGTMQVNVLQQNGFPAGDLQSVSVNEKGRITGYYSNGRTIELAEITLATFNGANFLKRLDGGAFEITDGSGAAIFGASGRIVGGALEGSNTDIADEFTKLIVTQQAYSANTRIVTTTNEMVQDLLNMMR
jgi:flagellar hook protein FlgE